VLYLGTISPYGLPLVKEMVKDGLVTMQTVEILHHAPKSEEV
jgi:hypothetical protein